MTAQPPLLAIEKLYAAYGLSRVLFGISLEVEAGECVCLLSLAKSSETRSCW